MIISKPAKTMAFIILSAIWFCATYYPAFGLKGYQSNTLIVSLSLIFLVFAFLSYKKKNTELYPLSSISFSIPIVSRLGQSWAVSIRWIKI